MSNTKLFDADEFFKLAEAKLFETGITPLESRNQPSGFLDEYGKTWVAILTDDGLKRQRL